jgi:hypothetical protein
MSYLARRCGEEIFSLVFGRLLQFQLTVNILLYAILYKLLVASTEIVFYSIIKTEIKIKINFSIFNMCFQRKIYALGGRILVICWIDTNFFKNKYFYSKIL